MDAPTSTAVKIMDVFKYFRVRKDGFLSHKLLSSKSHLWTAVKGETYKEAIQELIEGGYIIEKTSGYFLTEAGDVYLQAPQSQ